MKRAVAAVLSTAVIAACSVYFYRRFFAENSAKPNILVISACSLRHDMVPGHMPKVAEFFGRGSFTFTNAFNGLGWTALFSVTAPRLEPKWWDEMGYRLAGLWIKQHMYLIPPRKSWSIKPEERGNTPPDSNFEKDYRASLEYLLTSLEADNPQPYFVVAHIKYPHFPLIDRFNSDAKWDRFLELKDKARIEEYLRHPEKYPAKLPFLLMLTNEKKILHAHPQVEAAMNRADQEHDTAFLGVMTAPKLLAEWSASPEYKADLEILKKIYRANVLYLDQIAGEILERLENKGRLKNTVVMFIGDHGEVHMERGHLTHGTSWYDESLRIPLLIRMPGQWRNKTIDEQVTLRSVTGIIQGIAEGKVGRSNLARWVRDMGAQDLIARDCSNTWRAMRTGNRWKYAVESATGQEFLFDLSSDPGELHNIAPENPSRIAELERKFWEEYPRFTDQMHNDCAPWPKIQ